MNVIVVFSFFFYWWIPASFSVYVTTMNIENMWLLLEKKQLVATDNEPLYALKAN